MNISRTEGFIKLFMPGSELDEFSQYLSIAVEDLVNARPINPKKYFALALCRALPYDESLKYEFPELSSELLIEQESKVKKSEILPTSPTKRGSYEYPEGFQVSRRASVFGESMNEEELVWTPPNYPKDPPILESLKQMLKSNILFSHLDEISLETVAIALEPADYLANEIIVKQNDEGNSCFFIGSGKLSCFIQERGLVCEYSNGDSFGEVSIMYGNIRGATIKVNNM